MEINSLIVLKNSQYFILVIILIFSLLSLVYKKSARKFVFLFIFYFFTALFYSSLGFMELTFILSVPIILFITSFYLFELKKEIFSVKNISEDSKQDFSEISYEVEGDRNENRKPALLNYIIPVLFCLGLIFLFFKFNNDFVNSFKATEKFTIVTFYHIAREIFSNYLILIIILMVLVFVLGIWSITIINNRRKR